MADSQQLSRLVASAEDFADALKALRDDVLRDAPRDVTDITGAIAELYRISTVLRQLRDALEAPRYENRIYRIQPDVRLICRSAHRTLRTGLDMLGRANDMSQWMVWDDLDHRMRVREGVALSMRLRLYHNLTEGLLDQLDGYPSNESITRIKGKLQELFERQQEDYPSASGFYRVIESREFWIRVSLAVVTVATQCWRKLTNYMM